MSHKMIHICITDRRKEISGDNDALGKPFYLSKPEKLYGVEEELLISMNLYPSFGLRENTISLHCE